MERDRLTPDQIMLTLRKIDILVTSGLQVGYAIKQLGVSRKTYYRWRRKFEADDETLVCHAKEREGGNVSIAKSVSRVAVSFHRPASE